MANEQNRDDKDKDKDKPEERKNIFGRIGDFLNQPLPGTAPREKEQEEAKPAPPAQAQPAGPPKPPPAQAQPAGPPKPPPAQAQPAGPPKPPPAQAQPAPPTSRPATPPAQEKPAGPPKPPPARPDAPAAKLPSPQAGEPAPAPAQPAPAPTPRGLAIGGTAYVRREGGLPLRMRSTPKIDPNNIVERLAIGLQLTLIGGPQSADGYEWWQVRIPDGRTGWVAGSELVTEPQ